MKIRQIVLNVLFLLLIVMALLVGRACGVVLPTTGGAAVRAKSAPKHIVVDTLNLTHWLFSRGGKPVTLDAEKIVATIDKTAPILLKTFGPSGGRVMYVVKDKESELNAAETRITYSDAAKRNSVYIYAVERYEGVAKTSTHSARGRDDFYMALLARKYKCPVLTEDRFKDFDNFRKEVSPFHVYEFAYWRALPERDYVKPGNPAYRGLKKPPAIRYGSYLPWPPEAV